ncbi:putative ribonuclease H-like domain-containing protein, partial [Tanacetum coccineum]
TNLESTMNVSPIPTSRIHFIHPTTQILGDLKSAVQTRSKVDAIQEELLQFKIQKGYRQEEGTDYDEVFVPVARFEAIRIFLAFASYMGFIVYQMDVKNAFLYAIIDKKNGYRRGTIDKTLFIKKDKNDIMLVQVYVDDIIFGSTKRFWCDEFEALMKSRFQMSSKGELTFFPGLQVKHKEAGIFICQDKYVVEILKKFDFVSVNTASTPIETQKSLTKDEETADVDVHLYRSMIGSLMYLTASRPDIMFTVCACSRLQVTPKTSHLNDVKRIFSDYARANLDRKSTTRGCQFLGRRLISWQCKKQTIVATSTTEAEYVAAANCCGQVLWIQNQMLDYGFSFMNTKIYTDNESTICIVKNPIFYSKTKHIEIWHHFIRGAYEKKLIQVLKIHTDDNVADLLTKAFDVSRLRATYGAELVSAASLVNTARPTLSTARLDISANNLLNDADGTACLTNEAIFQNLALMGWNEFSTNIASAVICLETNQKFNFSKLIFDGMLRNLDTSKKKFLISLSEVFRKHVQKCKVIREKFTPLFGLLLVPTPKPKGVLALETSKDAQAAEILKLKDQIKKLKRKCKPSISHHRAWLKSVKRLSMKKKLGRKEYVSKQGRKNAKPKPTLYAFDDLDADGRDYMETEDVVKEGRQIPKTVSTARPELSTTRPNVDAARQEDSAVEPRTPPTTTNIEDSLRPTRSILTLKPLPIINPKDKGKSVLEEPEPAKKMTRSDFDATQIARDVEIARQLQVDLQAEVERERQREEEASKATIAETYDEFQVGIDANALFAAKLQQEEREEYTIEERSKFLVEIIIGQRKFRAAQTSTEIRSRPPTKSQLRNLMMTYLKNMGGYKHSQLKAKTFAEIQGLYERQKRVIDDFKPMDSDDAVKDSKEAAGVHKQKVLEEPNSTKVKVK